MYQQRLLKVIVEYNDLLKASKMKDDEIYQRAITRWADIDTLSEDLYVLAARLMIYQDKTTRKSLILACLEARHRIREILKKLSKANSMKSLAYSAKEVKDTYDFFLFVISVIQEGENDVRIYKEMSKNIAVLDYLESIDNNQVFHTII